MPSSYKLAIPLKNEYTETRSRQFNRLKMQMKVLLVLRIAICVLRLINPLCSQLNGSTSYHNQ